MTTTAVSVPKTWDDITREWMSAALAADYPGATVDAVSVAGRDDGTNRWSIPSSTAPRSTRPTTTS
ncbi:MAG: hypothetical protein QOH91_3458 [Mycobacterium sp.]|nr:hypothetical protein [Mycobacterium sp.]